VDRAAFQDFEPFREFVAGPEAVFEKAPPAQNTDLKCNPNVGGGLPPMTV
jgi:hypothetical protein